MKDDEIEIIPIDLTDPPASAPAPTPTAGADDGSPVDMGPEGETAEDTGRSVPWRLIAVTLVVAAVTAVGIAVLLPDSAAEGDEAVPPEETTTTTTARPPAISADVFAAVAPSVVFIETRYDDNDELDGGAVGAGVIVNIDGDILTAHHVVDGATAIRVFFADGTEATAQTVFTEPDDDIAVLTADQTPGVVVPAVIGGVGRLRVGDEAFAIGNPLGLNLSLSAGVISGFDRTVPIDGERSLDGLIQFDTAVNPGNSGGPLLDREGRVIGIVTALANPGNEQDFSGIGFAVPIETAGGAARVPGQ